MSRPVKSSLDYFPLDVNLSDDPKIEYITAKHGIIAEMIYIILLKKIYGKEGYYTKWSDRDTVILAGKHQIDEAKCRDIIYSCIKEGLFDENLFNTYQILTSSSIQKRYLKACEQRSSVHLVKEYLACDINQVKETLTKRKSKETGEYITRLDIVLTSIFTVKTPKMLGISTQSKVKESKVKYYNTISTIVDDAVTDDSHNSNSESDFKENESTKEKALTIKDFELVYDLYPRKVGKQAALKAIQKAIDLISKDKSCSKKEAFSYLINQTKLYAKQRENQDQQFTPHPQTWFNQGRYDDESLKPKGYQAPNNPIHEIPEGYEDHEQLLEKFRINGFINWKPLIVNTIEVNGRKYSKHRTNL